MRGRDALTRVRETWALSHSLNDRTLALLTADKRDAAFQLYEKESRAAVRQAIQAAENLLKHQQSRSEMRYEASTRHYRDPLVFMISLGVATLVVVMVIATVLARNIVRPLRQCVDAANKLANGNLTVRVDASRSDEVGQLLSALQDMTQKLNVVVTDVQTAADNVAAGSQQLATGALQLSQGASEQAASAEQASASVDEMSATIRQNAHNARQTETFNLPLSPYITLRFSGH